MMNVHSLRSKLARRLRSSPASRFPNLEAMASTLQPQPTAATLVALPLEIRISILEELWKAAGVRQHIMLVKGRYVRARCVTQTHHEAPDELMEECARYCSTRFDDEVLFRRMQSAWSSHWKCEEVFQESNGDRNETKRKSKTKKTRGGSFLSVMLVCRQLYLECRASIYSVVTFVIHDIGTLHSLITTNAPPILPVIKSLDLAIQLPIRRESKMKMSTEAHAVMAQWRACCVGLERAAKDHNLVSVNLWLDTCEPAWRGMLSTVSDGDANPFVFGKNLAGILTVDLPVNPERLHAWQSVRAVEPRFVIQPRGWPAFRTTEVTETSPYTIIRLWESAEPGTEQSQISGGVHYAHRRPRHLRA